MTKPEELADELTDFFDKPISEKIVAKLTRKEFRYICAIMY